MYYICSGYMLNCAFNTNHNPPEQIYIMTPTEFITIEEFNQQELKNGTDEHGFD